mmetsp:Transcript_5802/g.12640  ORF Transcript_5802/g.12640 Transcript_5802/m.12640 type:complete len:564 (+) Transcript_5802:424-2115(+)
MSNYNECVATYSYGADTSDGSVTEAELTAQLVACIVDQRVSATSDTAELSSSIDAFFLIFAASLVFFMQAGFAMLCAGSVQKKNVQNTMLKNLLDACGAALGFYSVGYAFAYGDSSGGTDISKTFIGDYNFFLMGLEVEAFSFWLFQFAFAATSATIVAGALAERCQMTAYFCYSAFVSGFLYPVIAHAVWSERGWLGAKNADPLFGVGMIDFAGSAVVHMTGGLTAVIAVKILGARKGRFFDDRGKKLPEPKEFLGHSSALQTLGGFILWFGWYGFNIGSTVNISTGVDVASLAGVNTTLSAAAGGVASLIANMIYVEKKTGEISFDLTKSMNGCLAGLVAITGGCAVVEPYGAIIIGFIAGLLYMCFSKLLLRWCVDDCVDAIPVHCIGGCWGAMAVGLFATPQYMENAYGTSTHVGWFYEWSRGSGNFNLLGCQLIGILFIGGWVTAIMLPFFSLLNFLGWLRADPLNELVGLDLSYHGGSYRRRGDSLSSEHLEAFRRRQRALNGDRLRDTSLPTSEVGSEDGRLMSEAKDEDLDESRDEAGNNSDIYIQPAHRVTGTY